MLILPDQDCRDRSTYGPEFEWAHVHHISDIAKVQRMAKDARDMGSNARVFQRVIRVNRLTIRVCVLVVRRKRETTS